MKTIAIYEPALCCETGVCGVNTDPELLQITASVRELQTLGYSIKRYNLNTYPMAFVTNTTVNRLLQEKGTDGLPCVLADGKMVLEGRYPTRSELIQFAEG